MKRVLLFTLCFLLLGIGNTFAQCAMCRSTLENNFSNGNPGVGAGINTGILYLLVMPYLAVIILGYFWLKSSRNAQQELSGRTSSR
ncbi:hypothetical protein KK083_11475 [Fulvivirgaceae bacterium PWU4]|uniref:Uncharacterized protein n=1 Tax=Chryseosolibacter histidini TaxID=2782349 RepID=A0AAP2DNT7_9BACT|nr:hypothetical protein [Chryseosolibacter histidini]MBT1697499.1 hypothetical protein [Chryseosolibacter histidini]